MPTSGFEVRGHIVRQHSPQFAKVRQGSPALLSGLLSKLAAGGARKST
jgi:hypothetical protein